MNNYPEESLNYGYRIPLNSYIRVLHAAPGAPAVDVYVNGNLIAKNLSFEEITSYIPVPPGKYQVEVFPAGEMTTPVISTNITLPALTAMTIAAIGEMPNISLYPIPEVYMPQINPQKSYVRFAHLSPNAPAVDVTLPGGTIVFENVKYQQYTDYMKINPGTYTLQVRPTGTEAAVLTVPDVTFMPGTIYSVYATGLVGGEPPLSAIVVTDSKY
jgi:Alginate O-acetyl transferase AlgF.